MDLCGPGIRGLTNFGNTCYFSSTVQAILHTPSLRHALCNARDGVFSQFKGLSERYFAPLRPQELAGGYRRTLQQLAIRPQKVWGDVKRLGMWGMYSDNEMEDANTLLLDVLDGKAPGLTFAGEVSCSACAQRETSWREEIANALLFPPAVAAAVAAYAVGDGVEFTRPETATTLSLAITDGTDTPDGERKAQDSEGLGEISSW